MIKPRLSRWDFAARERQLFGSAAEKIPTWRLANQARRLLADVNQQLSDAMPTPDVASVHDLEPDIARQLASLQLSAVLVRSTGSTLSLISCGYEREALASGRISLEAVLRGRQLNDDSSGDVARKILRGQRPGSLKSAAQRYGHKGDIEFLDRFAHADVLGLLAISTPRGGDGPAIELDLDLRPKRGVLRPAHQLLIAAHHATGFSVILVQAFGAGVEIPAWISGQLKHYRDNPLPSVL